MYETPSHLFLNKLLKPNTENVLGGPPTSLGNLLILPKKSSYNKCCFRGGGWKCMKNALPPPPYIHYWGWGMLETYPISHMFPNHSLLRRWGRGITLRSGRSNWKLMALAVNGPMGNTDLWWNFPEKKKSPGICPWLVKSLVMPAKKRAHQIAGSVHGIRRLIMGMKQGQI